MSKPRYITPKQSPTNDGEDSAGDFPVKWDTRTLKQSGNKAGVFVNAGRPNVDGRPGKNEKWPRTFTKGGPTPKK